MDIIDAIDDFLDSHPKDDVYKQGQALLDKREHEFEYELISDEEYIVNVPGEKGQEQISVYINNESEDLFVECSNPPCKKLLGPCHHAMAAVLFLEDELPFDDDFYDDDDDDEDFIDPEVSKNDEEGYTTFNMSSIEPPLILHLSGHSPNVMSSNFHDKVSPVSITTAHQQFHFNEKKNRVFSIDIIYDGRNTFKSKCNCTQKKYLICEHVAACFFYLNYRYDRYYFNRFRDFTVEKNKILSRYGLSVNDPEASDFKWEVTWNGSLVLKEAPSFIVPAGNNDVYESLKQSIRGVDKSLPSGIRPRLPESEMIDYEIGFVLNFTVTRNFGFEFEAAFVRDKKNSQDVKKLSIHKETNWPYLQALPDEIYSIMLGFNERHLLKWLESNGGSRLTGYSNPWNYIQKADIGKIKKRYFDLLRSIWSFIAEWPFVFALKEGNFSNKNVTAVKLGKEDVHLSFIAEVDARFVTIFCRAFVPELPLDNAKISVWRDMLFEIDNVFYLPAFEDYLPILEKFNKGMLKFPVSEIKNVIKNVIAPLQAKYKVEMKGFSDIQFISLEPQPRIMLSEFNEQYLMMRPQFLYDDVVIDYDLDTEYVGESTEQLKVVTRNKVAEIKLYEYLRTLHPKFSNQRNNLYYYLPFKEVMINNWFLHSIQQIQNAGFPVYGLQELKKFKYNTSKVKFDIKAGSGVDWFDLKISISWGDQHVSLKDIRKAVINNQNTVLLGDGTLGLIPEEWLKQYTPLMKIATEQNGSLRVSKLHYTLLDDINDHLDGDEIKKEIAEKKKKLLAYDTIKTVAPSSKVNASLRPYQISGFNWLQALESLGWGGCLADDMGLGKTLQTITFLQYLKEKNPESTHLVICPTSLIFNWESEIGKFCPSLRHHTYYGIQRAFDDEHFEQFDIVLTTYGMIRNDLDRFMQFDWHYIILDESQAIKNPEALITRAVQKLRSKNRIILSGTPVQNNTYDLYAQFTFLNPGFLGNREFFKNEFAQPIDGKSDKEKATQLRRMIYPFMLRRTKAQVATDLPDKTEMVLWCTMEKEQRRIYDRYKEYYRQLLLEKIDEEGIAKAGIYVLEGLLRLRQICDHPALLQDESIKVSSSVKTDELMREIQENTSDHKLLVFSQFTGMLSIIRTALLNAGIKFSYLDGSTPANQRKEQVKNFQDNETIKVFLISLKAGGIGLNLTAADYVYLIDPWWNPATEQQAIDRTHRIGQTRKIFAYKMICKDSVEEKILNLQEKKKVLASELVSEDASFVKKLTRDDISYLFS